MPLFYSLERTICVAAERGTKGHKNPNLLPGNRHCLFGRAVRSYQITSRKHRLFFLNIKCRFFTAWNGQYVWRQREAPKDTQTKIFLPGNRHCLFRRAVRSYQRTLKHRLFLLNLQQCHFFTAWNGQYLWRQREAPKDTQPETFLPGNRYCLFRRAVRSYQRTPKHRLFLLNIQCRFLQRGTDNICGGRERHQRTHKPKSFCLSFGASLCRHTYCPFQAVKKWHCMFRRGRVDVFLVILFGRSGTACLHKQCWLPLLVKGRKIWVLVSFAGSGKWFVRRK